ncbi:unnamed protein product [Chilo suppressalis]|uniref:G-protein coupled receptors family 1 profile domain-containing protein n=1 Tax=Chilo suppressalis TaxID=168631 RepID=A0ABN8B208_CHISP|nr:unnamed protein product [Chilo suppressalis]
MDSNSSDWAANETVNQLASLIYQDVLSVANFTNDSDVHQVQSFDLYEAYKTTEREQLLTYKWVAYFLGTLIILSNLTVVISSGLIIRKGQQPKSTYLLLGNVSLADTIIGMSIIFGAIVDNTLGSNQLCIFQLGMIVCPAMVSIFSVGLIAIDRYIYIIHGLYYQRWFNTTRVRIGIICIWMIGITLAFVPAAGWTNHDPLSSLCLYVSVFPSELVVFNSVLSIIPIIIVTVLYCIILVQALRNLRNIKATSVSLNRTDIEAEEKPKLRIYRGTTKTVYNKTANKQNNCKLKRSASFHCCDHKMIGAQPRTNSIRSKSTDDIIMNTHGFQEFFNKLQIQKRRERESNFSICTIESRSTIGNAFRRTTEGSIATLEGRSRKSVSKVRGPSKLRAVTVVMLTTGSFIITWMPFFTIVILFEFCGEKRENKRCLYYSHLISGPVAVLAFTNSFLNPLIYAWWHKGFKKSIKNHFIRFKQRYILAKSVKNKSFRNF